MTDLRLLFDHLVRFEIELWTAVDTRLQAECGLQLTWLEVLRLLDERGASRVQDLATEFGITTGGASKAVDRIEAAGYCRRRPNPANRRSSLLELTEDGERALARGGAVFDEELRRRIGEVLDEPAIEQLTTSLAALRAAQRQGDHL